MVFSELAAATLIAICGLKNSYRIILKSERIIRRRIRKPAPAIEGYQTFPRYFIRRIFRAGLVIAMRWEGRAKNAAQVAADARLRARKASSAVAKKAEDVRTAAKDGAHVVRERAVKARQQAVAAKDSMVRLKDNVQERIARVTPKSPSTSTSSHSSSTRKFATYIQKRHESQPSRSFHSFPSSNRGLTDALPLSPQSTNQLTHSIHSRI